MKGFIDSCIIKYNDDKDCFIRLPKRLLNTKTLSGQTCLEVFIPPYSQPFLLSWVGGVSSGDFVEISRRLGTLLNIAEGEQVNLKESGSITPVREVCVEPDSVEDWEILELNAGYLEWDILNQVRVVSSETKLPIWVHNVPITLCIKSLEPAVPCGVLDNQTEIIVLIPSMQKSTEAVPDSEIYPVAIEEQTSGIESLKEAYFPFAVRKDSSCSVCECLLKEENKFDSFEEVFSGVETSEQVRKCLFQYECEPKQECQHHECFVLKSLMLPSAIVKSFRVLPLELESLGKFPSLQLLIHHPNVLFISKETASKFHVQEDRKMFLCKLRKVGRDSDDEHIVMVVTISEDIFVPSQSIIVPDNLRLLLGLDISCRVLLESLCEYKSSPPQKIGITLHPEEECLVPVEVARRAVLDWLLHVCSCQAPLILAKINFIDLWIDKTIITLALTLPEEGTLICPNVPEYLLEFVDLDCKYLSLLTVNCHDLDHDLFKNSKKVLRGGSGNFEEGVDFLTIALGLSPNLRKLIKHGSFHISGNLLITGCRGSGKTTLAQAFCDHFAQSPFYVFSSVIDCARFRGKKAENIKKHFDSKAAEATERQPSLVVLDCLDQMAAATKGPEAEGTEEANYKQKLAELVVDFVADIGEEVAVVATACELESLHSLLTVSTGKQIFTKVIKLLSPSVCEREELLAGLALDRGVDVNPDVLKAVAEKTSSFIAGDLECIVNRALHNQWSLGNTSCKSLEITDFDTALEGFEPWSLIGGLFHEPDEMKWENVGGLNEGKELLEHILQWPTLFPDLFEQCPLAMNRGVLLYGPPGTGKTLLAKVVAAQCMLKVITIKGPELLSKYIGASEQAVRDVFNRARSTKPCLIFFDEFDSLAPRRGHDNTGVTDRVVNQLLTELDGVEGLDRVYILAATSRPDLIDPAILRPGRIDKRIYCPIPNQREREEILHCFCNDLKLHSDVNLSDIASRCEDFTGADLQALLYNAHLSALGCSTNKETVEVNLGSMSEVILRQEDLLQAANKTSPSLSTAERKYYQNLYQKFQHVDQNANSELSHQRATLA